MSTILVTGANGFVGKALCAYLRQRGRDVVGAVRRASAAGQMAVGDLSRDTDWTAALAGTDTVVHLAARVHVMRDRSQDRLGDFRAINVEATMALALQAQRAGVKRFIFVSSIGVNGAETYDAAFTETSVPHPHSDYAISKLEAEQALSALCSTGAMSLTIIRPPLVYGPNAPGNFGALLKLVECGIPLPLGAIANRRSLVSVDNLVDFICVCIETPAAAGELFLVADGSDVSTADIIQALSDGMRRKARLFPLPVSVLSLGARIVGKRNLYTQLCGSCQVDIGKAQRLLGWTAPTTSAAGLRHASRDYLEGKKSETTS